MNNIPNLDKLVSGLNQPGISQEATSQSAELANEIKENENGNPAQAQTNTLWNELLVAIEDSKQSSDTTGKRPKPYMIDEDIVATLMQCNFKTRGTTVVINCILRTFLIANLENLMRIRQEKPISLFETHSLKNTSNHENHNRTETDDH